MEDISKFENPNSRLNTCAHRSKEEKETVIKRCSCKGGDILVKSFFCEKRQILELSNAICDKCPLYEPK